MLILKCTGSGLHILLKHGMKECLSEDFMVFPWARMFFGESMFSSVSNASKFAFISLSDILKRNNFDLIDCQVANPHLISMGCIEMKRKDYLKIVRNNDHEKTIIGNWGKLLKF